MKKTNVFIAACAAALLSSCASYQQTAPVMAIGGNNIITNVAAELDYKSVKRIEGTVETQTLFGFNLIRNANKTLKNNNRYRGLNKRESQALYKAKTEAGVDIILEPEFETEKHSWFLGAYKTVSMIWDEDYRNVRHVPVLKAFLNQSDERTSYAQVKKDYASYKDEYDDTVRRLNGYEKEMKRPETATEYAERMDFLYRSPQMKRYDVMREYERELSKMYKMMQEYPDSEIQKSITVSINQLKANAVEMLRNIE